MAERLTFAVLQDHEVAGLLDEAGDSAAGACVVAVSYTHLTLPTNSRV